MGLDHHRSRGRERRGDSSVEALILVAGLMVVLAGAVTVTGHARHSMAIHDTARNAGYASLADTAPTAAVAEPAELAPTGTLTAQVRQRVEQGWQDQLSWLGTQARNRSIARRCANTASVGGVELSQVALSDHETAAPTRTGVLLEFTYRCEIPAPLGLDAVVGNMVITGRWAEVSPWHTTE